MTNKDITEIVEALEMRDYGKFVSFFADDAIFEIPFTVDGGTILRGLPNIKAHFENIAQSPLSKHLQIDMVDAKSYCSTIFNTVTIEYSRQAK